MGRVINYRSPRTRDETTAHIGMIIFLGSWAMMFAALFFIYAGLRVRSVGWPPPGVPVLPLALPALNTLTIGSSSVVLQLGLGAFRSGRPKVLRAAALANPVPP